MTDHAAAIYEAAQGCLETTTTMPDGTKYASVYLDNVRPEGISARQFAGYLSVLARTGLYRHYDDDYGFGDFLVRE